VFRFVAEGMTGGGGCWREGIGCSKRIGWTFRWRRESTFTDLENIL